jgi:hypothetical protein
MLDVLLAPQPARNIEVIGDFSLCSSKGNRECGGVLSQLQANQETRNGTASLPGELGQPVVKEAAGLVGHIGGGLSGLVQGLIIDLGDAIVLADKEQYHRRTSYEQGHLEDLLGKVSHGQADKERRTDVGQEKGGRKEIQRGWIGYGLGHGVSSDRFGNWG